MSVQIAFYYLTAPTEADAQRIADALIDQKLAACVNINSPIKSVYRWEGRIESRVEYALIAKSTRSAAKALATCIRQLHPDDVPCITAFDADPSASCPNFLNWIKDNVEV